MTPNTRYHNLEGCGHPSKSASLTLPASPRLSPWLAETPPAHGMSSRLATFSLAVASSYWGLKWIITRASCKSKYKHTSGGLTTAHPEVLAVSPFAGGAGVTHADIAQANEGAHLTTTSFNVALKALQLVFCLAICLRSIVAYELVHAGLALSALLGLLGLALVSSHVPGGFPACSSIIAPIP